MLTLEYVDWTRTDVLGGATGYRDVATTVEAPESHRNGGGGDVLSAANSALCDCCALTIGVESSVGAGDSLATSSERCRDRDVADGGFATDSDR